MFDRIVYISDKSADVKLRDDADVTFNLMNLHVIFEDADKKILGEVDDMNGNTVKVRFLGEITNGRLLGGVIRKPTLDAKIRVINDDEIPLVTGKDVRGNMLIGGSPFYNERPVYMDVNGFFSNHFAIMGNSGSGKSCGVSRIFQNMFEDQRLFPYKSNIIMFDSSGEYYNAFRNLSSINPNYNYRFISTNEAEGLGEKLRVPIYLLNAQDLALLLNVTTHSQLPIVERMLKLARIFSETEVDANAYKNHLIAQAIMTILYTNETAPNKRNEIFSIIASCSTPEFNLEAELKGIGYTRKFRDCFLIDQFGNFTESVLMTEYVSSFIKEEYDSYEPSGSVFYDLETLEKALNFTLISEGWLRNENTYGDSVTIRVRLHSLITGNNAKYFDYPEFVSVEQYISSLLITNGRKFQMVNINLDDVDDVFAKVMVKIFSRLIFDFAKGLSNRASIPFHLVVEEAHRYIQNDGDTFLIGYNIFDRIAKEGRKYGVILGLITQRPVEMSDTVISQCSNFLIFKMNHPADVEYIRKMVPNISDEIVEKQKTLQPGTCLAFGMAFKIPLIVKLAMPNPEPRSGNCDVVNIWDGNESKRIDDPAPASSSSYSNNQASNMMNNSGMSNTFNASVPSDMASYGAQNNGQQSFNNAGSMMDNNTNGNNNFNNVSNQQVYTNPNLGNNGMGMNNFSDSPKPNLMVPVGDVSVDDSGIIISPKSTSEINASSMGIPDISVDMGQMLPPGNVSNVPQAQSFINNSTSLIPDVPEEVEKPAIIIPDGQNVSNSLMQGFGGVAAVEENR